MKAFAKSRPEHQPGERVTSEGHITCGLRRNCRAGRRHFCPNTEVVGRGRDGAFAEYVGYLR